MIKCDLSKVCPIKLIEHLQEIEKCDVELDPNPFGFDIFFVPVTTACSSITNMEVIAKWAEVHKHTIHIGYNEYKEAIVVRLHRLYPDEYYNDDDILEKCRKYNEEKPGIDYTKNRIGENTHKVLRLIREVIWRKG